MTITNFKDQCFTQTFDSSIFDHGPKLSLTKAFHFCFLRHSWSLSLDTVSLCFPAVQELWLCCFVSFFFNKLIIYTHTHKMSWKSFLFAKTSVLLISFPYWLGEFLDLKIYLILVVHKWHFNIYPLGRSKYYVTKIVLPQNLVFVQLQQIVESPCLIVVLIRRIY